MDDTEGGLACQEDFSRVIPELILNDPKSIQVKRGDQIVNIPIPLTLDLGHKVPKTEILVYN